MKFILFFVFIYLSSASVLFSQNNGFIGKKNFISADVRLYTPLIAGLTSATQMNYKTAGTSYLPTKNLVDYGFNFSLGRAVTRNFGLILQYGVSFYDFSYTTKSGALNYYAANLDYNYNPYSSYYADVYRSNWFHAKSTTFMPIIEITNHSGLLPIGLSHQIGLGFTKHSFQEDNYSIQFDGYNGLENFSPTNLFDYNNIQVKSVVMMYKINLRIPVNKFILFNLGFRYNLNLFGLSNYQYYDVDYTSSYVIDKNHFRSMISKKEFSNILSLETGFSFCF